MVIEPVFRRLLPPRVCHVLFSQMYGTFGKFSYEEDITKLEEFTPIEGMIVGAVSSVEGRRESMYPHLLLLRKIDPALHQRVVTTGVYSTANEDSSRSYWAKVFPSENRSMPIPISFASEYIQRLVFISTSLSQFRPETHRNQPITNGLHSTHLWALKERGPNGELVIVGIERIEDIHSVVISERININRRWQLSRRQKPTEE